MYTCQRDIKLKQQQHSNAFRSMNSISCSTVRRETRKAARSKLFDLHKLTLLATLGAVRAFQVSESLDGLLERLGCCSPRGFLYVPPE